MRNTNLIYEGQEPYIFISYAHKDASMVLPIVEALYHKGFRVWYDAGIEAGSEWPEFIADHVERCDCMVTFISKAYVDSQNCRRELIFAQDLRKTVLSVYIEDVKLTAGMRMQLGLSQALFRENYTSEAAFTEELFRARCLQNCLGSAKPETMPKMDPQEAFNKGTSCYDAGDYTQALRYFLNAAEQGYRLAQSWAGYCYEQAKGTAQDYAQAVKWYRKAADQDEKSAQNYLGSCYYNGNGVTQDYAEAIKWYRKAADQDYSWAQYNLGVCYHLGKGVEKDHAQVVYWYTKAANQGHASAQTQLGNCYFNGNGVSQDQEEAIRWYRKAAAQGHGLGCSCLGHCYENGFGVEKDVNEALKWYRIAAEKGDNFAKKALQRL